MSFNILQILKNIFEQDDLISKSISGVFMNNFPNKAANPYISLEILNFKRNITNSCVAEIKIALVNNSYMKNLDHVVERMENKLTSSIFRPLIENYQEIGYFFFKDVNKKSMNNTVSFSFNLLIKLRPGA